MTELEKPQRLRQEPVEHGWSASQVSPDEYVDDEWIKANTKEVTDGVQQESDSPDS
jgi:hypothetical protein